MIDVATADARIDETSGAMREALMNWSARIAGQASRPNRQPVIALAGMAVDHASAVGKLRYRRARVPNQWIRMLPARALPIPHRVPGTSFALRGCGHSLHSKCKRNESWRTLTAILLTVGSCLAVA
ncbi:hypothetical protein AAFN86_08970 [Roseomonas sp. CAU 1739]|uniref:hypothetical protein n=1 Tax=Roseomonas sp. CAU 1739 TaxID=3140364 RepID=UPI00325B13D2